MSQSKWIHLDDVKIVKESASGAAFLIEIDGERYWMPKSQIADPEDYEEGDEGASMSITEWIASTKGIA